LVFFLLLTFLNSSPGCSSGGLAHRWTFIYALTALIIGGVIGLSLVGGFVYLVMNGHAKAAAALLGAGAVGMVAGFRSTRLN
jgi:hypothetical protein